ncbi:MAG TPA: hypothetical protein VKB93_07465 [Thermoanaerobaculia bacterium]|nr:hypothetical protein [Thermoanaerobaculia bacterium]
MIRRALCALLLLGCATARTPPLFTFQSNFWLNLHHFARVVARGMPAEGALTAEERELWNRAVAKYQRYVNRDLLFDDGMVAIKETLRQVPNDALPPELAGEPELRETLISIAPIYRKYWWPQHDAENRAWIEAVEPLVARYGSKLAPRVAAPYGEQWPAKPHPVDMVVSAGPNGAYTSYPPHSTISSFERGNQGLKSLELLFHEASHQWGRRLHDKIERSAEAHHKEVPRQLWHAVLFYNAGELTRRALAENGIAYDEYGAAMYPDMCGAGCREKVASAWDRHLSGELSLDEALEQLVAGW